MTDTDSGGVFVSHAGRDLAWAEWVAWQLREYEQARQLDEDTLTRRRRVLGDDHPHTLDSANNLAIDLRELGEQE